METFRQLIKDFADEDFTAKDWLVYGLIYPGAIVLACVVADLISGL